MSLWFRPFPEGIFLPESIPAFARKGYAVVVPKAGNPLRSKLRVELTLPKAGNPLCDTGMRT
jgi:hypothetical protein